MYCFNKNMNTSVARYLVSLSQCSESMVDTSVMSKGIIRVHVDNNMKKMKVQINKDNIKYIYDYGEYNVFPLQLGNGKYLISLYEYVKDRSYRLFKQESVTLKINDQNDVYLQSIQLIHWDYRMQAIKTAKHITRYKKTDLDKTKEIYKYIISKISYDEEKADTVKAGYIPMIDQVLKEGRGICYDYSVLFAAMLRSIGIPTKLLMGYCNNSNIYHAWNEVYIKEEKRWIILDTTQDAFNKRIISIFFNAKDDENYKVDKTY